MGDDTKNGCVADKVITATNLKKAVVTRKRRSRCSDKTVKPGDSACSNRRISYQSNIQ